jgi:hypothetical protein
MNSQPNPDVRIDQILNALRTTEPPAGLEQRIAARLAHARAQPTLFLPRPSFFTFGAARFYAATACTLLIALTTLTIVHRRSATNTAQTDFNTNATQDHASNSARTTQAHAGSSILDGAGIKSLPVERFRRTALPAERTSSQLSLSAQDDPDQIALAETLAPSRPAPPPALTVQEHRILAAMQPGQPIQMAELDLARAPVLRALAEARETVRIDRYVRQSLAPLAITDALSPTTDSPSQEDEIPPPPPQPSTPSPN